jgi:hypothetical protein
MSPRSHAPAPKALHHWTDTITDLRQKCDCASAMPHTTRGPLHTTLSLPHSLTASQPHCLTAAHLPNSAPLSRHCALHTHHRATNHPPHAPCHPQTLNPSSKKKGNFSILGSKAPPPTRPHKIVTTSFGGQSIIFGVEFQWGTSAATALQKAQMENLTNIALASLTKFMKVRSRCCCGCCCA